MWAPFLIAVALASQLVFGVRGRKREEVLGSLGFQGVLTHPQGNGPFPGVIINHGGYAPAWFEKALSQR